MWKMFWTWFVSRDEETFDFERQLFVENEMKQYLPLNHSLDVWAQGLLV